MVPPTAPRLDGRSWLLLACLALLWSASFVFIKVGAAEIPVLTLVFLRVALAALVLNALVVATRRKYPAGLAAVWNYAAMGALNNVVPFALIVYATPRIGAGSAAILNAAAPMFTLLIAHFATDDEKMSAAKAAGILFGIAGVAAMTDPRAATGLSADFLAVLAMLGATLCYGMSAVFGRRFGGIDPLVSATCQLSAATLILAPLVLVFDQPFALAVPSAVAIASVVGLAILSTALAYIIFYALITRAGGTNTMLVTLLIPVGGVLLGWLLLNERFTLDEAAGMLLIGLGLLVIDGRALRWLRQTRLRTR